MWKNFDGRAYTRDGFAEHVRLIGKQPWVKFVVLHNTSAPTLAQWDESGPSHDARIRNLQAYYEGLGWHAGPHLFISRDFINGFSPMTAPGVHASCFNSVSIGIEMVGDYDREAFDTGDGAKVRDNAVFVLATLHAAFGLRPDNFLYGARGLHFHVDCRKDNHACPGKLVHKPAIVARVLAAMGERPAVVPDDAPLTALQVQKCLNLLLGTKLATDGEIGPKTTAAILDFQTDAGITIDGVPGPETWAAIRRKMAASNARIPSG